MAQQASHGPAPGERRGGRKKGVPNKATIERALLATREVSEAKIIGRKLGKEVLEDFMHLLAGMAAHFQVAPPNAPQNPYADEAKFWKCAEAAIECAHKLAPYQSPTLRAIVVAPAPAVTENRKVIKLRIFEGGKAAPQLPPPKKAAG